MSDAVWVALIPSLASIVVALLVYFQARATRGKVSELQEQVIEVKVSVDGQLHEVKTLLERASRAEGVIQGAAEARAYDATARLESATAAALVLNPTPTSDNPLPVVIVADEPVPVTMAEVPKEAQ